MAGIYNIFEKVTGEIQDFDNNGIYIVGRPDEKKYEAKDKRGERGGYYHSQRQLLEAIDLVDASKFKYGIWDDEGQRKTYLNIANFYRDVMEMKINIDVVNYIFQPTDLAWIWPVWVFDKKFKQWADEESYDDQIDEYGHDLATYGTCVSKIASDCSVRVPLRTLRCTQSAKSLYSAAMSGGYVIIEDTLHYNEMTQYPDWDLSGLNKMKSYTVYERYALVPASLVKKWSKLTDKQIGQFKMEEDEDMVLAMAYTTPDGPEGDALLFIEKLDENSWPLDECHLQQIDGRWLGRGEMEKQIENQISKNLNANYRRRGILWAAKKVFQSTDENVQKNLVYEVLDGEVLHVKANGSITQINTQSQQLSDIKADDAVLDDNSQKSAFAFEVATGESLPANTPFRLGVVLSSAVSSHFTKSRKTFSTFLKRSFFDQVILEFEGEYKDEHNVLVPFSVADVDAFKDEIITYNTNLRVWNKLMAHSPGNALPNSDLIRQQVTQELAKNKYGGIEVPKSFYKNARAYMRLNLVDDIASDIADLESLLQSMDPGDPQRKNVLAQIFAIRGKALPAIMGAPAPAPAPAQPNAKPSPLAALPGQIGAPAAEPVAA